MTPSPLRRYGGNSSQALGVWVENRHMNSKINHKNLFGELMQKVDSKFDRCFWPLEQCSVGAIRAHSIQNAKVLDLVSAPTKPLAPVAKTEVDLSIKISIFMGFSVCVNASYRE
jgi:hypothetical protein